MLPWGSFVGEMFCIECNPRMHSCIVLSDHKRVETAQAIYQVDIREDTQNQLVVILVVEPLWLEPPPSLSGWYFFSSILSFDDVFFLLSGLGSLTPDPLSGPITKTIVVPYLSNWSRSVLQREIYYIEKTPWNFTELNIWNTFHPYSFPASCAVCM